MNRLVKQLHNSFDYMVKRNWEKIYIAVDIHGTVMEPTYSDLLSHKFYEDSIETLKLFSERNDCSMILWTSSNKSNAQAYFDLLKNKQVS